MAETVGRNPTSQGTLPAAHQAIPTLERSVATQAESQVPGFAQAFGQAALQRTAGEELSSSVIAATSTKIGEMQGKALAESNPNISSFMLPSLTKGQEAFEKAYTSRAEQVLGTQANTLLFKSMDDVNAAAQLDEGVINSFQSNAMQGVQGILKNAPDSIRDQMLYQYQNKIDSEAHSMRARMMREQHQHQQQEQMAYNNSQVKNAFDDAFSNGFESAAANFDLFKKSIDQQKANGTLTAKEHDALIESARINTYTGAMAKGLSDVRANAKLPPGERDKSMPTPEKYLATMGEMIPKTVKESERIAVENNVMTYNRSLNAVESEQHQTLLSNLSRALADGTLNGPMLASAEQNLTPSEFNNFMAKYWTSKNAKSRGQAEVLSVAANFTNPTALIGASPKQINAAFDALVDAELKSGHSPDLMSAKIKVAQNAGTEVPKFSSELDVMMSRGTPDQVMTALHAYNQVSDENPLNMNGVSKQSQAMAMMTKDLNEVAGYPLNDAWAQAKEAVFPTKPDEISARVSKYNDWHSKHMHNETAVEHSAKAMLNTPMFTDVPNLPYVANSIARLHKDYFMLTGDADIAKKLTTEALKKSYGVTRVNGGRKQMTFLPVEKLAGIGDDSPEVIHEDMRYNLTAQLKDTKAAYDKGEVSWYYQMVPNKKGEPVKVERVGRDKTKETFNVQISANRSLQRAQASNQDFVGYYDVSFMDDNGFPQPVSVVNQATTRTFAYRPNVNWIKQAYAAKHNKGGK